MGFLIGFVLTFISNIRIPISYDYVPQENAYVSPVQDNYPEWTRVTCYIPTGNKTASGCYPYEGMCAGRREDIGKVAILYDKHMRYIGCFEIKDTGGEMISSGERIDIFRNDMASANEWIDMYGDYCYVQIVDAEG